MKRIFLHIGTHKTGTTAIQKFLSNAEEKLREDSILYPKSGRPDVEHGAQYGHHLLAWAILKKNGIDHFNDWERVVNEIKVADQRTVVLSAEGFESCTEEQVQKVSALLDDFEVHIILYLRNPFDYTVSSYKQFVKSGITAESFEEFAKRWVKRCNYSELVQRWARFFERKNVHVTLYDRCLEVEDYSVEKSILDVLGVKSDRYKDCLAAPANVSPSDEQIGIIRTVNLVEKWMGSNTFLHRARRSLLRRNRMADILLALTRPVSGPLIEEIEGFRETVNTMNRPLQTDFVVHEDWQKYLKC